MQSAVSPADAVQQEAPPQQSHEPFEATLASQMQAGHAQAAPQHAHAALTAFDVSARLAPNPTTPADANANAPNATSTLRRFMIKLPNSLTSKPAARTMLGGTRPLPEQQGGG